MSPRGMAAAPSTLSTDLCKEPYLCIPVLGGTWLTTPAGRGNTKSNSAPHSSLTSETLEPQGKNNHHQISTYNRTNSSKLYSHQVNEATRGNLGWRNFMAPLSSAMCQRGSDDGSKIYCLSSAFALPPVKLEWWGPSAWGVTPTAAPRPALPGDSHIGSAVTTAVKFP